ncbi:hypothetical protein F2Q68_00033715 [Brassica cretica]|uniref:Uncharacterized protein n=1 Tax=Brassica cretica TaxID=69181 RepID=A0A8S9H854_BRACR|nr:hypothetical protein F2Q68_00033715 [Brassica cretica]
MGSISDSEEQFTFDPEYSPPNTVDLGTHQVMATLAALEEVDDQLDEDGESGVVRKKQGKKRKLIILADDTDDSDVEITPPTQTTKPRRKTSYGTASRKPMFQSTLDGGIGSSAQACSKENSVHMKSVIHGGRRKPVPNSQKKRVKSRQSQKPAASTQSQKNKKKIKEIPDFDDELEEDELDEAENGLEDMKNRQRPDVWKDFTVVEKPNGDLKAVCNHCKHDFSRLTTTTNDLEDLYKTYGVDRAVVLDLAGKNETPETVWEGYCGAYLSFFHSCGLIFPVPEPILEILAELGLSLTQILPNFLRYLIAFLVRAKEEGRHIIEDIPYRDEKWREQFFVFKMDRASMGEFDFFRLPRSWAENMAPSGSSSMSDGIHGLIGILRRGYSNWSSFDQTRIRTVFAMPEGINRDPLVGGSEDEAEHSQEVAATPSRGRASGKSPFISIHDSGDENASEERRSPISLSPGSEDEAFAATRKRRRSSKGSLPGPSRPRFFPEGDVMCPGSWISPLEPTSMEARGRRNWSGLRSGQVIGGLSVSGTVPESIPIGGIRCAWVVPVASLAPVNTVGVASVPESDPIGSMSLTLEGVVPTVWLGSIIALRKLRPVSSQRCFSFIFPTVGAKM